MENSQLRVIYGLMELYYGKYIVMDYNLIMGKLSKICVNMKIYNSIYLSSDNISVLIIITTCIYLHCFKGTVYHIWIKSGLCLYYKYILLLNTKV